MNKYKLILGVFIGIILTSIIVYAIDYTSDKILYDNTTSQLFSKNVQGALKELYEKAENIKLPDSFPVFFEGDNITFSNEFVYVSKGGTAQVTITPESEYYISGASCTNGYTLTNIAVGISATSTQIVTINNNNIGNNSICNISTRMSFAKQILADNPTIKTNPTLTRATSSSGESGLYSMNVTNNSFGGGGKTTYFFRGDVSNNVVEFAGKTWRIVRINEDSTVRLVLDTSTNTSTYCFDDNYNGTPDMYYSSSNRIKYTANSWFNSNITGTNASKVVSGNYFCEAAKVKPDNIRRSGDKATMLLYSDYTPKLDCSIDGNNRKYVSGSVGLMSYDEVVLAGGYTGVNNTTYYLNKTASGGNNNYGWWTMSPAGLGEEIYGTAWIVNSGGGLSGSGWPSYSRLRPVINLKADTIVTGSGTASDPYVVQ